MPHRLNGVTQFSRSTVSSISVGVRNLARDDNWDGASQAHGKERRNRVGPSILTLKHHSSPLQIVTLRIFHFPDAGLLNDGEHFSSQLQL